MPKISFVMPTKNRGHIIEKAIKTIIAQTLSDWELIIVDDHSDAGDKTNEIVDNFGDDRIKYFRLSDRRGGGIAEARNYGNQLALAPIIAVADSDDLQLPNRAQITVETFAKESWDVFYGKYYIIDEIEKITRERKSPIIDFNLGELKKYNYIPHGSSAYRREIAYDFPYNSFFKIGEDYDFFTRLAKNGKKFYFHNNYVYKYVVHGENVTSGKRFTDYEDLILSDRGWKQVDRNLAISSIFENEK